MCSGVGSRVLLDWVSPFGHPRITARLPAPRGLSQAPTSFIGSWCQGIHRVPLKTCHRKLKMLASTMQFSSYERNPPPNPAPTPTHPDTIRTAREAVHRGSGPESNDTHHKDRRPFPQDPTACQATHPPAKGFHPGRNQEYYPPAGSSSQLVDVPPMSKHPGTLVRAVALDPTPATTRATRNRARRSLERR